MSRISTVPGLDVSPSMALALALRESQTAGGGLRGGRRLDVIVKRKRHPRRRWHVAGTMCGIGRVNGARQVMAFIRDINKPSSWNNNWEAINIITFLNL